MAVNKFINDMVWSIKADHVKKLATEGHRLDNRGQYEYRSIEIIPDYIPRASGSALVSLGGTTVLAGISVDVGEPYPDSPNEGVMVTSAELVPLASPTFEAGPPDEDSIELARVVDRGIRESKAINTEKLFIEDGKVWVVFIDLHVLDYDGNLFDASTLAAITSLLNSRLPKYEDETIIRDEVSMNMPIQRIPVETTFAKIGDVIVADPIIDEEKAADARLTLATTEDGYICAAQKGGLGSLKIDEIENIIDVAFEKGNELRSHVKKAVGL